MGDYRRKIILTPEQKLEYIIKKQNQQELAKWYEKQILEKKIKEYQEKMKEQELYQRYNYLNPGYGQRLPIIGRKPIFKDYEYINNVNRIKDKIKYIKAEIKSEKKTNIYLEFMLENHLIEKKNLEKELKQQRNKNFDLVKDFEAELNENKQLEKELEENIENVQGKTLENEFQEIYSKIKYLQKKYEEVIDTNREMSINDINEEEEEANDNSRNNYYNNGLFNTL